MFLSDKFRIFQAFTSESKRQTKFKNIPFKYESKDSMLGVRTVSSSRFVHFWSRITLLNERFQYILEIFLTFFTLFFQIVQNNSILAHSSLQCNHTQCKQIEQKRKRERLRNEVREEKNWMKNYCNVVCTLQNNYTKKLYEVMLLPKRVKEKVALLMWTRILNRPFV